MARHIYWDQIMEVFACHAKEFRFLFWKQSRTVLCLSQDWFALNCTLEKLLRQSYIGYLIDCFALVEKGVVAERLHGKVVTQAIHKGQASKGVNWSKWWQWERMDGCRGPLGSHEEATDLGESVVFLSALHWHLSKVTSYFHVKFSGHFSVTDCAAALCSMIPGSCL